MPSRVIVNKGYRLVSGNPITETSGFLGVRESGGLGRPPPPIRLSQLVLGFWMRDPVGDGPENRNMMAEVT